MRYFWLFGDGVVAEGAEVTHSYARSGNYSLSVVVSDDNGAVETRTVSVTIFDQLPIVDGPFGFTTGEGTTIVAEVGVYDSTVDEPTLHYQWEYNSEMVYSRIFTTMEDDGFYRVTLLIFDSETLVYSGNISLAFIEQPPQVVASNFLLYGAPSSVTLKAFAIDSFLDTPELTYEWAIDNQIIPNGLGLSSSVHMDFQETRTYYGHVAVQDDSPYKVYGNFTVVVVIDSDGDGLNNEIEAIYGTNTTAEDSDGDYLPDKYELEMSHTNPLAWDSDNDGLCDGLDTRSWVMTGEVLLGTDPQNPDTDGDNLTDGQEVLGWPISVYGWIDGHATTPTTYQAHSNPLKIDTDNDGLSDWLEKTLGYDPEKPDTDGDGISDLTDSNRGAVFDSDYDGLSDLTELTMISRFSFDKQYFLTTGHWENAMVTGTIENTKIDDQELWAGVGGWLFSYSPSPVNFIGEFHAITSVKNRFTLRFCGYADYAPAQLSLWNGHEWVLYKSFTKSTTALTADYVQLFTDEENATTWIQGTTFKFKLTGGANQKSIVFGPFKLTYYESYIGLDYIGMENFTLIENTLSDPNLPDTDSDGLSDWEEYYPGTDGYITDPRNNDTDHDHLLDSAEKVSFTREYGKRERCSWIKTLFIIPFTMKRFTELWKLRSSSRRKVMGN